MAWLSGWKKRISLTVTPSGKVDSQQSDFPARLHLSTSSGISSKDVSAVFDEIASDANRKKIAITTSDGVTQCYIEIEKWDNAGEDAELWAKIPSLSSAGDTIIYLYYDSSQPDNTTYVGDVLSAAANAVWDPNFATVYHCNQDPDGDATDAIKDSTSNLNHATPGGSMTTADLVDAQIGKGIDFEGADDNLHANNDINSALDGAAAITMEMLVNIDSLPALDATEKLIGAKINTTAGGWNLYLEDVSTTSYLGVNGRSEAGDSIQVQKTAFSTTGSLVDLVGVLDFANDLIKIYIDGVEVVNAAATFGSNTYTLGSPSLNDTFMATAGGLSEFIAGTLDEARISKTGRSAAWLKATHYSNDDNLITYGDEVTMMESSLRQSYALNGVTLLETSHRQTYALDGVTLKETSLRQRYAQAATNLSLSSLRQAYTLYGAPVASLDLVDVYYQLYVGTELVPFSSLRGSKRNAGQDSIYVVIPNGRAWIDAVTAQEGQDLVLKRGGLLRSDLSAVAPAEFIRATFETSAYDKGSRTSAITLMGFRDIEAPTTPKGVELQDVSYEAIGTDGKRRTRCRMDDTLKYGDQATLPDETFFTVGEISYTIASARFQMEVKEQ